jgi:RNA-directed DNA polymerase
METLQQAYSLAKKNNGAPGIDGVTFEAIEALGVADFLNGLQDELTTRTYKPLRARRTEIPKDGGKDGYRPKRTAHQAVDRVARAIVERKTCVIDLDLRAYFDTVRHDVLLGKVARRVNDDDVMRLLKR